VLFSWLNAEEQQVKGSLPQLVALENRVDFWHVQIFGFFFGPHQLTTRGVIDLKYVLLGNNPIDLFLLCSRLRLFEPLAPGTSDSHLSVVNFEEIAVLSRLDLLVDLLKFLLTIGSIQKE
jgi:hypothetical protein